MSSELAPDGLKRNQLAWLQNGTVRGGGINCRLGRFRLDIAFVNGPVWSGLYQGAYMYEPDAAFPYIIMNVGGRTYQVRVDTDNSVVDVTVPGQPMSALEPQNWFVQAEQFTVIQNGIEEPRVWDNDRLWLANTMPGGGPTVPIGGPMDYYAGRLWVANGRAYVGSDIVRGPSGTSGYQFRDSVLKFIENTYLSGGGAFTVPTSDGNIRALAHTANMDTALGQSDLYVFTRKAVYATSVPPTRSAWITTVDPLQRVVQSRYGTVSDRSVVPVNGDLFFRSMDGIRSLQLAIRYFHQWGQVPISRNQNRVLRLDDRSLLRFASGIEFDNRLYETVSPFQTDVGVAHAGIMPLDFDLISSLDERYPPAWEGMHDGLQILQLLEGDFGGRQRAFAITLSRLTNQIEVWEISSTERFENGDNRITWYFETPAYTWRNPFQLKQLDSAELWIDKLFGSVDFTAYYRPNQLPGACWILWHAWKECQARDCREDIQALACDPQYPTQQYCEGFRSSVILPKPPTNCEVTNMLPTDWGYQFQFKLVVHGWCRIRGLLLYALERDKPPFEGLRCGNV